LISANLLPLVRCAAQADLTVTMTTNGFTLSPEAARHLAEAGLGYLALSLDGFDQVHNQIRQRSDAFSLALRAMTHATDNGLRVRINCVICELNLELLPGFITWVRDNPRLESIFFQALAQPFGEPSRENWWQAEPLFPKNPARAGEVLRELLDMKRAGFPILNPDGQFAALSAYFENPEQFVLGQCRVGAMGLTIDAAGVVRLCSRYEPIGDLMQGHSLRAIFKSAKAEQVRAEMAACRRNCHLLINCCFEENGAPDLRGAAADPSSQ